MNLEASRFSIGARREGCGQLGAYHVCVVEAAHLVNAVKQVLIGGLALVTFFSRSPRTLLVLLVPRDELGHLRIGGKGYEGAVRANFKHNQASTLDIDRIKRAVGLQDQNQLRVDPKGARSSSVLRFDGGYLLVDASAMTRTVRVYGRTAKS